MIDRVICIVLDSLGIGEMPDAAKYGDQGSNTLANMAKAVNGLFIPNLARLGLGNLTRTEGVDPLKDPAGAYGKMGQLSPGKDTTTGHWEIAGIILDRPFPTYPEGFPLEIIEPFQRVIGRRILGNKVASGTVIIEELGKEHLLTGKPIVYTSADSVFQIAAHEQVIPVEELYLICRQARDLLQGDHGVGRVIARPFIGQLGNFQRTANRHDFSLKPPHPTLLNFIQQAGYPVISVGKISDIFAGEGITGAFPIKDNNDGIMKTLEAMEKYQSGLIFVNLVDFDSKYGHRNDPQGYAKALEQFDTQLPLFLSSLQDTDVLVITADHGCDPTTPSTDHSREYVPLLVTGARVKKGIDLGVRRSFSDLGKTISDLLGIASNLPGESMLSVLL
ncbi:MAG TPA: phosphopentomutase [Clostridia bacterium]|nr:phosphopentomutase [Clostridia bacterium]